MSRTSAVRDPSVVAIGAAGLAATVGQILLLRELLVLFHGNEMSVALVLAGWLLWTAVGSALAARRGVRRPARWSGLAMLVSLVAVALPAAVLLVRGARWVFGIPTGESPTLGQMVLVCLGVPAPICLAAGALFALCWACRRGAAGGASSARPLGVYLGEAVGAALGGLVFYFALLGRTTALAAAVLVALLLLAVAGWILRPWTPRDAASRGARRVWLAAALAVLIGALLAGRLDEISRRWQWGRDPAVARDTPFHHVTVLEQDGLTTVFANGLWLFSQPDPATAELAVHPALLLHPEPGRLLFLGGGLAGQVREALEHPSVREVDYVEQDPQLVRLLEDFLDDGVRRALADPRVRIHHQDAATFVRRQTGGYDVILMGVGDPLNAQTNRFYTIEQFRQIARHLRAGGLFSFSVPGGGDVIGPAHARLLGSMAVTLSRVFPEVAVLAGERARFLAARAPTRLVLDPAVAGERARQRGLDLAHVRDDVLMDLLSPLRLEYVESLLAQLGTSPVNRQFSPVCYYHLLMLWAAQWHPAIERLLGAAVEMPQAYLLAVLAVLAVGVALFFWTGPPRYRWAVGASVLVQGATGMVVQIVLILAFQILAGYAYLQLALIIAAFMVGLALGTLWVTGLSRRWPSDDAAVRWLLALQAGVTAVPLLLLLLLSPLGAGLRHALSSLAAAWVFSAASLVAGVFGGAHFSLAALAWVAAGAELARTGGRLYALDLAGAAGGAFACGLLLLPLAGVSSTLALLAGASLVCLVTLLRR